MPSISLATWQSSSAAALDEIEAAHGIIGGAGPGRRYATQQINQAYAVLLSSRFQKFCRDLHSECVDHLTTPAAIPDLRYVILSAVLTEGRKLDSGNPNPGNIGSDFARFQIKFWDHVKAANPKNVELLKMLEKLNEWRNAIAHQNIDPAKFGGRTEIRLVDIRRFRSACNRLAISFDKVMQKQVAAIIGKSPW